MNLQERIDLASRRSRVEPFRAMNVLADANRLSRAGQDVVMMCVGQPDAPAPSTAIRAASAVLESGKVGYTNGPGLDPLRLRITQHYRDKYEVEVDPERVFVTTGSSAGFILSFLAFFDAGDRVAIPSPGYPAYRNILRALDLVPVEIETTAESGWILTPELLRQAHAEEPLRGVLVASPNNPNGTMMSGEELHALIEASNDLGLRFISDEIYHGLSFEKPETTALAFGDNAIIINSFSKYYCMTGWRIGWMIVPEDLIDVIGPLQQNAFICAPGLSQVAGMAAFDGADEMEAVKQVYARSRELFIERLPKLGITQTQPIDGGFYAYANVSPFGMDSMDFASRMLHEAGVAATPGHDFDSKRGGDWMRFSFAGDHERMIEGFDRLERWVTGL